MGATAVVPLIDVNIPLAHQLAIGQNRGAEFGTQINDKGGVVER